MALLSRYRRCNRPARKAKLAVETSPSAWRTCRRKELPVVVSQLSDVYPAEFFCSDCCNVAVLSAIFVRCDSGLYSALSCRAEPRHLSLFSGYSEIDSLASRLLGLAPCALERRLMQVEHLDQADPSRTINAANDGCVGAARQCNNDGRFTIIGWRQPGTGDFRLLGILPIIVGRDDIAIRVVQRQRRIKQRGCDSHVRE